MISPEKLRPQRPEFDRFLRENRLEHLRYNRQGELVMVFYGENGKLIENSLNIARLAEKYGTPLEITNENIIRARAIQFIGLAEEAKRTVQYPYSVEFHYATKANPHSSFTKTAAKVGWGLETSSQFDLEHIRHAMLTGQINKKTRIYTNGIAPLPHMLIVPDTTINIPGVKEVGNYQPQRLYDTTYLELINLMNVTGHKVVRIIDTAEEINYFLQGGGEIAKQEIGVREVAYSPIKNEEERRHAKSRHGMTWEDLQKVAEKINKADHLKLTTYHAMISAASEKPVDEMVESLLYFADHYFALKAKYPTMKYFNMGGGIPAIGFSKFDHSSFFQKLLSGLKRKAEKYGLEAPILVCESGSGIATEASSLVAGILNVKTSGVDKINRPYTFVNGNTSIMTQLPDTFILGKNFPIIPGNNANDPTSEYMYAGPSCDGDDQNPRKEDDQKRIRLPLGYKQIYVVPGTGAYQDSLYGGYAADGSDHCGYLRSTRVFAWVEKGQICVRATTRGSVRDAGKQLGY